MSQNPAWVFEEVVIGPVSSQWNVISLRIGCGLEEVFVAVASWVPGISLNSRKHDGPGDWFGMASKPHRCDPSVWLNAKLFPTHFRPHSIAFIHRPAVH